MYADTPILDISCAALFLALLFASFLLSLLYCIVKLYASVIKNSVVIALDRFIFVCARVFPSYSTCFALSARKTESIRIFLTFSISSGSRVPFSFMAIFSFFICLSSHSKIFFVPSISSLLFDAVSKNSL